MTLKPPGDREQLRADVMKDPEVFLKALNDIFLSVQQRIAALEALGNIYLPEPFELQTNKTSTAYGNAPFPVRVSLPAEIIPRGVLMGSLVNLQFSGAPATVAQDVKWKVKPGGGGLFVNHIPGLSLDTKYLVQLVVIRG